MNATTCHLSPQELLAYWLHESSPAETEAADEHLMQCDSCGQSLDALIALGAGIRQALLAGEVAAVTSGAFLEQLHRQGHAVREYRLPHDGSVFCTAAPGDELLASRLAAPLEGIERLDVIAETSLAPGVATRLEDVPFDAAAGEIVWIASLAHIRHLPEHTTWVTLVAPGPAGDRQVGRYAFQHTPWEAPAG